jgi:hypothetical protein
MPHRTKVALNSIAIPAVVVVPGALKAMRNQEVLIIGAGFASNVLFPADTTMGHALVVFSAGGARNRREGSAN